LKKWQHFRAFVNRHSLLRHPLPQSTITKGPRGDGNGEPSLHNTFVYDRVASTWTRTIDNVDKGQIQPFAKLKLTRH
jgi:hypothetical protein